MNMQYTLNQKIFKKRLIELGYKSLVQFSRKNFIHRNTLRNLLTGQSIFTPSFEKVAEKLKIDPLELLEAQSTFSSKEPNIDELRSVVSKLRKANKSIAVVLIGSRARGRARRYSDWDIGIFSHTDPISGLEYLKLKRMVEETTENLVRQVDLVNLNQAPIWFLENLKSPMIFLDGNEESHFYLQGLINGIQKKNEAA